MKNLKTCLILLMLGSFPAIVNAQTDEYPETVTIRIYESFVGTSANIVGSSMHIVDADSELRTVSLLNSERLMDDNKEFSENLKKIRAELQRWHTKGFKVTGMASSNPVVGLNVTTIILQKN